jgi:hypothetical protein
MRKPNEDSSTYLGDGAYATYDGYHIVLYTDDGIERTNQVFLEPQAFEAFFRWAETYRAGKTQEKP